MLRRKAPAPPDRCSGFNCAGGNHLPSVARAFRCDTLIVASRVSVAFMREHSMLEYAHRMPAVVFPMIIAVHRTQPMRSRPSVRGEVLRDVPNTNRNCNQVIAGET